MVNEIILLLLCSLLFSSALLGRMLLRRDSLCGIVTRQRGGWPRNRGSIPGRDARTKRPQRSGAIYTSIGCPSEIWGTRNGVAEQWSRLGCDGVSTGKQLRTFRRVATPCFQSSTQNMLYRWLWVNFVILHSTLAVKNVKRRHSGVRWHQALRVNAKDIRIPLNRPHFAKRGTIQKKTLNFIEDAKQIF